MVGVTVSTAERMATLGVPRPESGVEIDGVLDDVALRNEVRRDVHRGVGDEQGLRMPRDVHDEDVADAASGPQPGFALHDFGQQLIGMQASLHQEFGLARADELDSLLGGGLAVRHVDDLGVAEVERKRLRHCGDLVPWDRRGWALISPASPASSAPLKEVSSQGCATAVASGVSFLAAAMRRSYFSWRRKADADEFSFMARSFPRQRL